MCKKKNVSELEKKNYDITVAYRIYPEISRNPAIFGNDKYKLAEFCLKSFKNSLGSLKVKILAILDKCPPDYEYLFKKFFDEKDLLIIKKNGMGNRATFGLQIEILLKQQFSNIIYFAEDDYYYLPNQFEKMVSFLKRYSDVDFISPYDHLNYYFSDFHRHKHKLRAFKNKIWRTVNSICLTFLTTKKTLQKTKNVLNLYTKGKLRDTSIFLALTKARLFNPFIIIKFYIQNHEIFKDIKLTWYRAWKQILFGKKRKVWYPIPTIATHMESTHLSPSIDWQLIFKQEVNELKIKRFEINCPFCDGNSVSDIIDSIEDVDGQWECSNGHQFVIKYIRKMEKSKIF